MIRIGQLGIVRAVEAVRAGELGVIESIDAQVCDLHDYIVGIKENPYSYDYEYSVERIIRKVAQI